jgi:hypothetical protein
VNGIDQTHVFGIDKMLEFIYLKKQQDGNATHAHDHKTSQE